MDKARVGFDLVAHGSNNKVMIATVNTKRKTFVFLAPLFYFVIVMAKERKELSVAGTTLSKSCRVSQDSFLQQSFR